MRMFARWFLPLTAMAALVLGPASSADAVVIVAVPGSFQTTYGTPVASAPTGGPLVFVNSDLQPHDVVAQGKYLPRAKARKVPWCKGYSLTKCPVFWSKTISDGETPVELQYAKPGTYTFYCQIHPRMTGTLVILPAGGVPAGIRL